LSTAAGERLPPEEAFERPWQADVVAAARPNRQGYYDGNANPKDRLHDRIVAAHPFVGHDGHRLSQEELAQGFGVTGARVRYALPVVGSEYHRLVRPEVRDQVHSEGEVDEEIRGL
jgi:hypothetical protein